MDTQGLRRALLNGEEVSLDDATLPVSDDGVMRADASFETVGVYDGRAFRLEDHLQRLAATAEKILHPRPDLDALRAQAESLLDQVTVDGRLKFYVTYQGTTLVLFDLPPSSAPEIRLEPVLAPWVLPPETYGVAGAKTMSYMPNMTASRVAVAAGATDALLVTREGAVLEGPTFAVYWAVDGVLHAPQVGLGIVDSISRRTVLEEAERARVPVVEGTWKLEDLVHADEFMMSSAVRPVLPVARVGAYTFEGRTPVRDRLAHALEARRRA